MGFKPLQTRRTCLRAIEHGLERYCAGGQQHGIDRREIVVLSVQDEKGGVGDQVGPSQRAI